jgi:hypothetical protein
MKPAKRTGCGSVVILAIAASLGAWWFAEEAPSRDFEDLLKGNNQVTVVSVRIEGHGRRIDLRDAESMQYLTLAFRSAQREGYVPTHAGTTYTAEMRLSRGGSVTVGYHVPSSVNGLTVAYPLNAFADPTYYWVPLSVPMPNEVSRAITQMSSP